jgi:phage terminase small subunit
MKKLTPKQARFVDEYMVDLNATQAAIRAGYSKRTARVIGGENLTKPAIAEAITVAKEKLKASTAWDAQWVRDRMQELAIECLATNQNAVAAGLLNTMSKVEGMQSDNLKIDGRSNISFKIKTGKT